MLKVKSLVAFQDESRSNRVVVGFQRRSQGANNYTPGEASLRRLQKAVSRKVNEERWTMLPTCIVGFGYVAFPEEVQRTKDGYENETK